LIGGGGHPPDGRQLLGGLDLGQTTIAIAVKAAETSLDRGRPRLTGVGQQETGACFLVVPDSTLAVRACTVHQHAYAVTRRNKLY